MPSYSLNVECQTGASASTVDTLLGLKFANTAGHVGKLRRLVIGGNDEPAEDEQFNILIQRSDNTTDGTSTSVATSNIAQADPNAIASNISAMGKTYTVEPTTIAAPVVGGGPINGRGTLVLEWQGDERPIWGKDQTLLIRTAPQSAAARKFSIQIDWDE